MPPPSNSPRLSARPRGARARAPRPRLGTKAEIRERAWLAVERLAQAYPKAECALVHDGPLQLLIATILSAQCTDERVNMVTPALFRRYPTARAFANAEPAELERMIQSTGF